MTKIEVKAGVQTECDVVACNTTAKRSSRLPSPMKAASSWLYTANLGIPSLRNRQYSRHSEPNSYLT
jgi:hypothetical protein